eukprot:349769-Rhodomonas_salina.1
MASGCERGRRYTRNPPSRSGTSRPRTESTVPTTHALHAPPAPSYPMLHRHMSLPTAESLFAGQLTHVPDPFTSLYAPAAHGEHAAPSVPSYPTLQMQSVIASLPSSEPVLAGHDRHTDPPVTSRYVPASQLEQGSDPLTGL